ncbi:DUF402 domain-containing protein [Nonomuraea longispora]|uniref:DUF402 domain-containing protein n=1 Tax=Nonomuraea longispora TaxID=1848320 RepID=UPI001C7082EA|nr:DUF402 domain-containing protein [Nonomuraea longispora]
MDGLVNTPPHKSEIYVDVTTIPEWRDGEVTMLDLDLDVIRLRDGRLILDDEDEFAEHQVLLNYPPDLISQAEATARWLLDAVRERKGPFGGAHIQWLAIGRFQRHGKTNVGVYRRLTANPCSSLLLTSRAWRCGTPPLFP